MADEAVLEAVEVDPKKLIFKNGVISYEKPDGFQAMTNFDASITGYVAESLRAVIGYLAEAGALILSTTTQKTHRGKTLVRSISLPCFTALPPFFSFFFL